MSLRHPTLRDLKRERLKAKEEKGQEAFGDALGSTSVAIALDDIDYVDELEARIKGLQKENEHLRELLGAAVRWAVGCGF